MTSQEFQAAVIATVLQWMTAHHPNTDVAYPNGPALNQDSCSSPWLDVQFRYSTGGNVTVGTHPRGRERGTIILNAFQREGTGTRAATDLIEELRELLRANNRPNGAEIDFPVRDDAPRPLLGWYRAGIKAPFRYDSEFGAGAAAGFVPTLPAPPRYAQALTADKILYVRTDGNDANDGSANDAAHALATPQAAFDYFRAAFNPGPYRLKIKLGDTGTFGPAVIAGPYLVDVEGDTATPSNTVMPHLESNSGAYVRVGPLKLHGSENTLLQANYGGAVEVLGGTVFGDCNVWQITAWYGGTVYLYENYEIAGASCLSHMGAYASGVIEGGGTTVTISGANTFAYGFAEADTNGSIFSTGDNVYTVAGTITGPRFQVYGGGLIAASEDFDYFPGDAPGVLSSGGNYGGIDADDVRTVAQLPIASTAIKGARAIVTDATATAFASAVAGGGANTVPVYCDGATWRIG